MMGEGWVPSNDNGWAMTSARVEVLRILLIERRKQAGLTQAQLAEKLGSGWHQSTVASMENGQRKIDVLEFLKLSEAIGFDPAECDDTALKEEGQHGEDQVFGWCSANGWKMTSARLEVLRILLIERRKQAGLTQAQLAEKLGSGWHQSTVASMENGQRKIDGIEFLKLSEVIGFDPAEFLTLLSSVGA
jgi:transcriptional regulator with XRE-family HTH domain